MSLTDLNSFYDGHHYEKKQRMMKKELIQMHLARAECGGIGVTIELLLLLNCEIVKIKSIKKP